MRGVKYNSPLYGLEEGLWFAGVHTFAKYLKVTFFNGAKLEPLPPDKSKMPKVRYLNVYEGDFDPKQLVSWIKQASRLPGEKL